MFKCRNLPAHPMATIGGKDLEYLKSNGDLNEYIDKFFIWKKSPRPFVWSRYFEKEPVALRRAVPLNIGSPNSVNWWARVRKDSNVEGNSDTQADINDISEIESGYEKI